MIGITGVVIVNADQAAKDWFSRLIGAGSIRNGESPPNHEHLHLVFLVRAIP